MIYLDNAATTWPKPESVYQAVEKAMREGGANPGRSGHTMAIGAGRIIQETRELIAGFMGFSPAERVIFTSNATEAINYALKGLLKPGDHVVSGTMEHNAVARPLAALQHQGVEVTKVKSSVQTGINPEDIRASLKPQTKLIAVNHASNVTGTINPIGEIGKIARWAGVPLLVDCAQTAGTFPIDMREMNIDLLAFPGHKGLLGPQGTGGLCIGAGIDLTPLKEGGTGSKSESIEQPLELPDRYESGTLNFPGIAGLGAGIKFIQKVGLENIRRHEEHLTKILLEGLGKIPGITLYGPVKGQARSSIVSFNIQGVEPGELALILDRNFNIAVRSGLHCAPGAHMVLGTIQGGTVRLSPGYFNTEEEMVQCITAVTTIAREFA
jgi:cysteine desulfurase family protein